MEDRNGGFAMGNVFKANEYAQTVQLQLLCIRAANAVSYVSNYLLEEEGNVARRWNYPWEVVARCCLGIKRWRVWAFYEVNPLVASSEAWLEAQQLVLFHGEMSRADFWEDFSALEYDLLCPLLTIIEEICELHVLRTWKGQQSDSDAYHPTFDEGYGGGNLLN